MVSNVCHPVTCECASFDAGDPYDPIVTFSSAATRSAFNSLELWGPSKRSRKEISFAVAIATDVKRKFLGGTSGLQRFAFFRFRVHNRVVDLEDPHFLFAFLFLFFM